MRLAVALLVPWFLYWGWRLFNALQREWVLDPYRTVMVEQYDAAQAERDLILVIALGVPAAIIALILAARWVMLGFEDKAEPPGL